MLVKVEEPIVVGSGRGWAGELGANSDYIQVNADITLTRPFSAPLLWALPGVRPQLAILYFLTSRF